MRSSRLRRICLFTKADIHGGGGKNSPPSLGSIIAGLRILPSFSRVRVSEARKLSVDRFKEDIVLISVLSGITAKIVQTILGLVFIMIWPTYLNCTRIAAGLILTKEQVMAGGFLPFLLGVEIDFVVGVVVAAVTVLALRQWGHSYATLKGIVVGLVSWTLFYGVLSRLLSRVYPVGTESFAVISSLKHIVFGITLVYSALWYARLLKGSKEHGRA